jgi:AcrR family transcriptional regulator
MPGRLQEARERERVRVKREISAIAVQLFDERGYDQVTMEDIAAATGVSVATLYRRFTTKENVVCWQSDEEQAMATLVAAIRSGHSISSAAMALARTLPDDAVEAIAATARTRLQLIADHAPLQAAAREKSEVFLTAILEASQASDQRPLLERETETRCVAAAFQAGSNAWLRGEGSLRECTVHALTLANRCHSPCCASDARPHSVLTEADPR